MRSLKPYLRFLKKSSFHEIYEIFRSLLEGREEWEVLKKCKTKTRRRLQHIEARQLAMHKRMEISKNCTDAWHRRTLPSPCPLRFKTLTFLTRSVQVFSLLFSLIVFSFFLCIYNFESCLQLVFTFAFNCVFVEPHLNSSKGFSKVLKFNELKIMILKLPWWKLISMHTVPSTNLPLEYDK